MSNCCNLSNPLIRDGISQQQRPAAALNPDYVKVDERDLADFLVFAHQLAQQVNYYDLKHNQLDGDWQAFFSRSTPVWIALISKTRPEVTKTLYTRQLKAFLTDRSEPQLQTILNTWIALLEKIQQWYEALQPYTPLKSIIKGLVQTNLQVPLTQLRGYEMAVGIGVSRLSDFASGFGLSLEAAPDTTPLTGSRFEARTALDSVFQVLFQNYRQIIQTAPQYLIASLEARQDHQPHLALYFAFLAVMQPVRDDLNRITQRHLDFFYREVLRLPARTAQPDRVHALFELAKFQQVYGLKADIRFKAGKDATGVELFYKLDEAMVVDKAQIVSLKSLFLDSPERRAGQSPQHLTGLYASPVANSFDGQGVEFPKDQTVQAWLPFGNSSREAASLGLAISSSIFLMQEGKRTVTLEFEFDKEITNLTNADLPSLFRVDFSGEKAWLPAKILSASSLDNTQLTLKVQIEAGDGAVVPFHADLQEPALQLNTQLPVVLVRLRTDRQISGKAPYHFFHTAKLKKVRITVEVDAVRNLVLQNDLAVIDPTKPFQPFGPRPKAGANFYIGSQEVFQKQLTSLKIHVDFETDAPTSWAVYYQGYKSEAELESFNPEKLTITALRQKTWQPTTIPLEKNLFSPLPISFTSNIDFLLRGRSLQGISGISLASLDRVVNEQVSRAVSRVILSELERLTLDYPELTEPLAAWTHESQNGFLRLQLSGDDFLHDEYAKVLSRQVLAQAMAAASEPKAVIKAYYRVGDEIKQANSSNLGDLYSDTTKIEPIVPNEPFTPVIQSLYLSYTATADEEDCQLFHLHPFDRFAPLSLQPSPYFLPQFTQEGELLIGLQDLQPQSTLNLLFQVAEETADTDLQKAEVRWHYLVDNTWKPFEAQQVLSDGTNGLIASGIVQLAIPADISRAQTTLLDPAFHWLKLSVPARSSAICRIVNIHTQAGQATFIDQGNDPNHLAAPLPAGAIAKLAEPQPAIKTVEQPYDSFGGRPQESSDRYYIRISERLRHKGRAIAIFDYERLLLERFPEIYKVRCINHGRISSQNQLTEIAPGAVTLAVIPDLSQRNTTNALEPKVNINLLETIRQDLAQFCSPWVDLRVVNPLYEPIRVEFQVRFKAPYEANFAYYSQQLNQAIVGFLSPWTVEFKADIHFGGKIYRSSILNFVEEQLYVDHVINFKMHQGTQQDLREVAASTARSILVSVPFDPATNQGHLIQPITAYPPNLPPSSRLSIQA